jgi:tetratricopeptide (TPR) repeat protein
VGTKNHDRAPFIADASRRSRLMQDAAPLDEQIVTGEAVSSLVVAFQRPYFDLEQPLGGPLSAWAPLHRFRSIGAGEPLLGISGTVMPSFRVSLRRESGAACALTDPRETRAKTGSAAWERLCGLTDDFPSLAGPSRALVAELWSALGFHGLILEHVAPPPKRDLADHGWARRLALVRSLTVAATSGVDVAELERIEAAAPRSAPERFTAVQRLALHYSITGPDPVRLAAAVDAMRSFVEREHRADGFEARLRASQLRMMEAHAVARSRELNELIPARRAAFDSAAALGSSEVVEQLVARAHQHALAEHCARQDVELGWTESAERHTRLALRLDPADARSHLRLGRLLVRAGRVAEAGDAFLAAARHGPPGTARAYFYGGSCLAALGKTSAALQALLRSYELVQRRAVRLAVARCAADLRDQPLEQWARAPRSDEVGDEDDAEPFPEPTAEGNVVPLDCARARSSAVREEAG